MKTISKKVLTCSAALALFSSPLTAQDQLSASFDPPGGLSVEETPQLIILGFDDNVYTDGMEWVLDLLKDKKNPSNNGNPGTFDGDPIMATFYFVGNAIGIEPEDDPARIDYKNTLRNLWLQAVDRGYEVGNHTYTHPDIAKTNGSGLTDVEIVDELNKCRDTLAYKLNVNPDSIVGFRTPYLSFNKTLFDVLDNFGFKYECTVTYTHDYNKKQHIWPSTLHEGFPSDKVLVTTATREWVYNNLWELPVYCTSTDPSGHPQTTNFDSSILTQAYGNQFELMLKNALDYRLKDGGNRTPLTVGLHSDTYSDQNESAKLNYDPQLSLEDRKTALTNFIEYALTFPEVRFVTAKQAIAWMKNPVALGADFNPTAVDQAKKAATSRQTRLSLVGNPLQLSVPHSGTYSYRITTASGREVMTSSEMVSSEKTVDLISSALFAPGIYFYTIAGEGVVQNGSFVKK